MDLEDTLGLGQTHTEAEPETADDVLGLDTQIKLSTRAKIAKVDNQRIFHPHTGLNYITKNHQRLIRSINKNDKNFEKSRNKVSKSAKYDHEYNNLTLVLQFYQLWCHGLFPKAKFKDCIQLIRNLAPRSAQLRIYRRELLDQELNKLRREKGIMVPEQDPHEQGDDGQEAPADAPDNDEDDWSFMNVGNGLFVGEDDGDADPTENQPTDNQAIESESIEDQPIENQPIEEKFTASEPIERDEDRQVPQEQNAVESDDPFSDDDDDLILGAATQNQLDQMEQELQLKVQGDDQDDAHELELMREFN